MPQWKPRTGYHDDDTPPRPARDEYAPPPPPWFARPRTYVLAAGALALLTIITMSIQTVPAGHVATGTLFGKTLPEPIEEGFHLTNPLVKWHLYDTRQKTTDFKAVPVPSADQLTSTIDFSVQWHANRAMTNEILNTTGTLDEVVSVHLVPRFRSTVRERAKGVEEAEHWFTEEVQTRIQSAILADLQASLAPKGLVITGVLLRNVAMPKLIQNAIEAKKNRQQQEQLQQAELERYRIEQEQKIADADAKKRAAELDAERIIMMAEAEAKANRLVAASLTEVLVQKMAVDVEREAVEKWNGTLPQMTGGAVPFVDLRGGEK